MLKLTALNNFNPLTFLDIDTSVYSAKEIIKLQESLNSNLGEYILLKLSNQLTDEQLDQILNSKGVKMLELLEKYTPNVDQKIMEALKSFKEEYKALYNKRSAKYAGNN